MSYKQIIFPGKNIIGKKPSIIEINYVAQNLSLFVQLAQKTGIKIQYFYQECLLSSCTAVLMIAMMTNTTFIEESKSSNIEKETKI